MLSLGQLLVVCQVIMGLRSSLVVQTAHVLALEAYPSYPRIFLDLAYCGFGDAFSEFRMEFRLDGYFVH
jgi:hypothetical protein